jgi:hypothetical protein
MALLITRIFVPKFLLICVISGQKLLLAPDAMRGIGSMTGILSGQPVHEAIP